MMDVVISVVESENHLDQILALQQINLPTNLSSEEINKEGFVSVEHTKKLLREMASHYPHVVALLENNVVAYALMMHKSFSQRIPMLTAMFNQIDNLSFQNIQLQDATYMIMGQICIQKEFRSQGIFKKLYDKMDELLVNEFDYIITEIAPDNKRSLRAHLNYNFTHLSRYLSDDGRTWDLVIKPTK